MKRLILTLLTVVPFMALAQYTPRTNITGYPTFLNNHKDSVGVLRNVGNGTGAYGKVRLAEMDTAAIRAWFGPSGSADGNNLTTGISFNNQRLTLTRSGLSSLNADLDTLFFARRDWVRKVNDSLAATLNFLRLSDTASMLSGYRRAGNLAISEVTGLQTALDGKQASGSYSLVGHTHVIADVTGLSAALSAELNTTDTAAMLSPYLRSAAAGATYVPLTRTINGLDLTANRTLSTSDIGEGTNQYFTNARSRSAISLTTTGSSGASTYSSVTGVLNVPTYTLTGLGGVPTSRTLTINGTTLDLSADRSWTISSGGVSWGSITGTLSTQTDLQSALNAKLNVSDTASMLTPYLRSAAAGATYVPLTRTINGLDLTANRTLSTTEIGEGTNQYFTNARARSAVSLTTTGASGASTYNSTTGALNVPTYTLAGLGGEPTITAGTTAQYWRGDKSWQTLNTTAVPEGTNLYYTDSRARSSISLTTTGTSGAATYNNTTGALNVPNYTAAGLGAVPTSRTLTINGTSFDLSADRSWSISAGAVAWGGITGTLSSQTDLQTALDAKQDDLISGTNLMTVNGTTLLGSGDVATNTGHFTNQRRSIYSYFNELINTVTTSSPGNDVQATNSGTSAATSAQASDATNRIGLVRSTTGSTATGRTAVNSSASAIRLGGGAWTFETFLNVTTLSNATERYQLAVGFFDTYTAANQVDGVYFLYDEGAVSTGSTAAAYWQTVTTSNSVRVFNNGLTQTTVSAATWVKLRIEVNAAATQAQFYINDALVATHTGSIPTGAGRETGFGWLLIKSVGTTARTVDFDYLGAQCVLTTAR